MNCVADMGLTIEARKGIRALGMSQEQALTVVQNLTIFEFHKTMPCNSDPSNWQDVYRPEWKGIPLYVKFQEDRSLIEPPAPDESAQQPGSAEDRCFVISFKEWTEEWK
jgi:hypothetical protein